jgi:hypothetical protein
MYAGGNGRSSNSLRTKSTHLNNDDGNGDGNGNGDKLWVALNYGLKVLVSNCNVLICILLLLYNKYYCIIYNKYYCIINIRSSSRITISIRINILLLLFIIIL